MSLERVPWGLGLGEMVPERQNCIGWSTLVAQQNAVRSPVSAMEVDFFHWAESSSQAQVHTGNSRGVLQTTEVLSATQSIWYRWEGEA